WAAPVGSTAANSVAAVNSNNAFNTTKNVKAILEDGSALSEIILNLSMSLDNGVENLDGVGYETPAAMPYRKQRITGNLELYHSSTIAATVAKFRAQTETSLSFQLTNGSPACYYVFRYPAIKFTA